MKKLFSFLLAMLTLSFTVPAEAASSITVDENEPLEYGYSFGSPNFDLYLPHDTSYGFTIALTNTGTMPWFTDASGAPNPLRLATVRPQDQEVSPFYNENIADSWVTANRIRPLEINRMIQPEATIHFTFAIKAPSQPGVYLLALQPVAEGETFLPGEPLLINVIVDNDFTLTEQYQEATTKKIVVSIAEQHMYQTQGGDVLNVFVVSTGKSGLDTPKGVYTVGEKNDVRYSNEYHLYMDNWMGLKSTVYGFQGYGIHKLPYWKTKNGGRIYEGEEHLGRKVSHGCVRLGYEESKTVYDWADMGTVVEVV